MSEETKDQQGTQPETGAETHAEADDDEVQGHGINILAFTPITIPSQSPDALFAVRPPLASRSPYVPRVPGATGDSPKDPRNKGWVDPL